MKKRNIVVIGASAGGVSALPKLFAQLPPNLPASFFVVLHISAESPSVLAHLIDRAGPLTAKTAEAGEPILPGCVYVAPPNLHLLVEPGRVALHKGPRENRHRPAVDPLFRSAAVAYQSQVIGIVLTGLLDDGSSGLLAVKRCGGIAIVQDPEDAEYPDMPANAIEAVEVDYQLPLDQMGNAIQQLVEQPAPTPGEIPADIVMEAKIAQRTMSDISKEHKLGHLVSLSCPECNGPLWQIDADRVRRYRCHVGHSFTAKALMASQDFALEQALWTAMRTMEERANISQTLARDEQKRGREKSAQVYQEQSRILKGHARVIRDLLTKWI